MLYLNSHESHNIFSRKNYECADGECANLLFLFQDGSMLTGLLFLFPIINIAKEPKEVIPIIEIMGTAEGVVNILTPTDAMVPMHICNAPNKAEAEPAFLLNGAKDKAAVLGLIKPRKQR